LLLCPFWPMKMISGRYSSPCLHTFIASPVLAALCCIFYYGSQQSEVLTGVPLFYLVLLISFINIFFVMLDFHNLYHACTTNSWLLL